MREIDDLRETIVALDGLLGWMFLSQESRARIERLRAEVVAELDFILAQQAEAAKAS